MFLIRLDPIRLMLSPHLQSNVLLRDGPAVRSDFVYNIWNETSEETTYTLASGLSKKAMGFKSLFIIFTRALSASAAGRH